MVGPSMESQVIFTDRNRFAEIMAGIYEEDRVTEGFRWKEALLPANRYRFFIVVTLQIGLYRTYLSANYG